MIEGREDFQVAAEPLAVPCPAFSSSKSLAFMFNIECSEKLHRAPVGCLSYFEITEVGSE